MGTTTARLAPSPASARPRLHVLAGGAAGGAVTRSARPAGRWAGAAGEHGDAAARAAHPAGRALTGRARSRAGAGSAAGVVPLRGGGGAGGPRRRVGSAPAVAGGPVRAGGARPALRLTRRGRIVVRLGAAVLALLAALVLALLLTRPAVAGGQRHEVPVSYHVVLPGETLWGIAGELAPEADRREVIAEIVELNALPGSGVDAGQRIALPSVP